MHTVRVAWPAVPGGLTACQEKAAKEFIDGTLAAHEGDHRHAFTTNYDGTFTASVSATNILDTDQNRQRAIENPVNAEDQKRTTAANKASAMLDPFKKTIPGFGCVD